MTTKTMKQAQQKAPATFDHIPTTIIIETLSALSEHPDFQAGFEVAREQFLEDHEAAPLTEDEMIDEVEMELSRRVIEQSKLFSRAFKCKQHSYFYNLGFVFGTIKEGIGTLVIGKNANWKQEIHIGKRNNQNFTHIPHARFIDMLRYKAELVGITVEITEESHTSKCSFLDLEPICHHEEYMGKRVKRGLFRSSTGRRINADVQGSLNIIRKAIPDSFGQGIEGVAVRPVGLPTY